MLVNRKLIILEIISVDSIEVDRLEQQTVDE
jgi:hypothetical protein